MTYYCNNKNKIKGTEKVDKIVVVKIEPEVLLVKVL